MYIDRSVTPKSIQALKRWLYTPGGVAITCLNRILLEDVLWFGSLTAEVQYTPQLTDNSSYVLP